MSKQGWRLRGSTVSLGLIAWSLTVAAGCQPPGHALPSLIQDVTVAEADALIKANPGDANFVILDVRTRQEYDGGHLQNAEQLNVESGTFRTDVALLEMSKTYLVYCRTARRSGNATTIMDELGFEKLYDMQGGITAWQAAGLPVVQ